mgnify:CR=1 FL=1
MPGKRTDMDRHQAYDTTTLSSICVESHSRFLQRFGANCRRYPSVLPRSVYARNSREGPKRGHPWIPLRDCCPDAAAFLYRAGEEISAHGNLQEVCGSVSNAPAIRLCRQ